MSRSKKPDARKISKRLNLRQRRFIAEFTNPQGEAFGNQTKAAQLAGYEPESAYNQGHRMMKNDEVRTEIERVMDEGGVSREKVAEALKGGLEADTIRVFCQEGQVIYSDPLIDHPTRLRAAEIASKLRGDFPTIKTAVDVQGLGDVGIAIIEEARKRASERHETD